MRKVLKLFSPACVMWVLMQLYVPVDVYAQRQYMPEAIENQHLLRGGSKCGTMEVLARMIQQDPSLPAKWKVEGERKYQDYLNRKASSRLTGEPVIIPVVVHIVADGSQQALITDRDVQEQIEILNRDFSGQNGDTLAIPAAFKQRFGRSKIQFRLARTDPNGNLTSGIERKTTATAFEGTEPASLSTLKHDTDGLNAWDGNKYFNIWVANFTDGLLGIATFPFMTPANEQGVCIDVRGWGTSPFYTYTEYKLGRTLVHEVGHYFYLFHIWSDDNGDCTFDDDFITQTGFPLPDECTDDTPNQGDHTFGYYGGMMRDQCSNTFPGYMFQNYMDYADDHALHLFTDHQVCRMEGALEAYRSSLMTSNVITAPPNIVDANIIDVTPGARRGTAYAPIVQPMPLKVKLRNTGSAVLQNVVFNVRYDAGAVTTYPWTGALAVGKETEVVLPAITGLSADAVHAATVYTTDPNGVADAYVQNDTLVRYFYVSNSSNMLTAPVNESFDALTFPPTGWKNLNEYSIFAGTSTGQWDRSGGTAGIATHSGAGATRMSFRNAVFTGQFFDLNTPLIDYGTADSSILSFYTAHACRGTDTLVGLYRNDGLEIWVSTDSGRTYEQIVQMSSVPDLRSVFISNTSQYTPTSANDWKKRAINLTPFLAKSKRLIIRFRGINGNGNDLLIDDIEITKANRPATDAALMRVTGFSAAVCQGTISPIAIFKNMGMNDITTLNIHYRVDNEPVTTIPFTGNVLPGQEDEKALGVINTTNLSIGQQHILKVYTSLPNGAADQVTTNDTLRIAFQVSGKQNDPLKEGFENTLFSPLGWIVINPDYAMTWERTTRVSKTGTAAAFMNNRDYVANSESDLLLSPVITPLAGSDSLLLTFQLAASVYARPGSTATALDTLEILVTTDCGRTYTSVYKKWGNMLQTTNNPNQPDTIAFFPAPNQWRQERVDLTAYLAQATASGMQVAFRNTSNHGNNIFIDDVNLQSKTLPARLKAEGYLIAPNPFESNLVIQHYLLPTGLQNILLYNATGQLVYRKDFNGNATTNINIDMGRFAAGIYTVQMRYSDKVITQRVIKAAK